MSPDLELVGATRRGVFCTLLLALLAALPSADPAGAQSQTQAAAPSTAVPDPVEDPLFVHRFDNALAMNAKLLCSGVFVAGREPNSFIEMDLTEEPNRGMWPFDWKEIQVSIDRSTKRVTLYSNKARTGPRTAVFNEGLGCTILPEGAEEVSFKVVPVKPNLPDASTQPWPMGDVMSGQLPREVNRAKMEAALDFAFDTKSQSPPQNTRALLVVYKGQIVGERYAPGFEKYTRQLNWSMGKALESTFIGILVTQGALKIDDPAPIREWQQPGDPRREITLSHLLRMSSGLDCTSTTRENFMTEADDHNRRYFAAMDIYDHAVSRRLLRKPGTYFTYRNCDVAALGLIVKRTVEARGENHLAFPQRALFDRIGARHWVMEVDAFGGFISSGFDYAIARDWARLGILYLQKGMFNGQRILSEEWVNFVRTPAPADPNKSRGGQFALNAGGSFKSLPLDTYWPAGARNNQAMIIPSRDMVIVRLGHSIHGGFNTYFDEVSRRILDAVGTAPRTNSSDER